MFSHVKSTPELIDISMSQTIDIPSPAKTSRNGIMKGQRVRKDGNGWGAYGVVTQDAEHSTDPNAKIHVRWDGDTGSTLVPLSSVSMVYSR